MEEILSVLNKIFSIRAVDNHIVILIFGIKICVKRKVNVYFKEITELGVTQKKRSPRLIISLTTFPARINTIYKTISTLMQQTLKPDEIVLWLAESQFPEKILPENLTRLCDYGLTIKWCEDIRSFKKLVPSLREYPNDIIVTFDDDFYYDKKLLENLYEAYLKNPENIHAHRAFRIGKKSGKFTLSTRGYVYDKTYKPSYLNEIMSGSGVLYPPHSLHEDVLREDVFMKIIPTNDDIWFWAQAIRKGTKISVLKDAYKTYMCFVEGTQEVGLCQLNNGISTEGILGVDGVNMMAKRYPEIRERLLADLC